MCEKDYFDFFDLARELRDQIYSELMLLIRRVEISELHVLRGFVEQAADPQMLLVSRQYGQEYRDRVAAFKCLIVEDHLMDVDSNEIPLSLPSTVLLCPSLHLELYIASAEDCGEVSSCKIDDEVAMHKRWIDDLLNQLSELRGLTISLSCASKTLDVRHSVAFTKHLVKLTALAGLRTLTLFPVDFQDSEQEDWDYGKKGIPTPRWQPTNGKFESITDDKA